MNIGQAMPTLIRGFSVGQSPTYIDWILENEANVGFQYERMLEAWNLSVRELHQRTLLILERILIFF